MRKVHLVDGHVVYVYLIDTVYVKNNEGVMKRKLTCTNYFIILEKKIFKRAHQKSKC